MGKGLEDIWGGAKQKTAESEEAARIAREAADAARAESRAEIAEMQRQIIAGEGGTGNPLHDGIIALYGEKTNSKVVERYERIASELAEVESDDLIVLIRRFIESSGCSGFGGHLSYSLKTATTVGQLGKKHEIEFDYEAKTARLPVAKQIQDSDRGFSGEPLVSSEPIAVDGFGYMETMYGFCLGQLLDSPLRPHFGEHVELPFGMSNPVFELEILVGRENIRQWLAGTEDNLARDYDFVNLRRLSKALGVKTIEPATHWQEINVNHER